MAKWYTNTIIADLEKLPGIKQAENHGPGGDCDSDNLLVTVKGTKGRLFVCAFTTDDRDNSKDNPSDDEFPMVEVTDGTDSRGGYQQFKDKALGQAYLEVCGYFTAKGFEVVPCLKDYF